MAGPNVFQLYSQYLIRLIVPACQGLAGKPRSTVVDEATYREEVIEPIWTSLPLPFRLTGRAKLCWDDFMLAARGDLFLGDARGNLTIRADAEARLERLARRLLAQPVGSSGSSATTAVRSGSPTAVVKPASATAVVKPAALPVARPVAVPVAPARPVVPVIELQASAPAIGIDLGTTYSVVAYVDAHGRPTSLPNAVGDIVTPSVVLIDEGGPVVGKEAVLAAAMEPEKVAECAKRDMGSQFFRKKVNGEFLPPEVISSLILRALKADADRKLGKVKHAVITVPAYFDESRRQATIDAGKIAGLEVLDIINEPTAAAIAYGYQIGFLDPKSLSTSSTPMRVLVYDLGGGTFDVTIVEIQGNSFKAIATDGDNALGGKDWDEAIVQLAAEQYIEQHREDPRNNPLSLQELWQNAEIAKKTLSERPKATMFINHLGTRMKVEIGRNQFEEATAALLGRTRTTTEIVVRQAGLPWARIDKILLVGGSTRMPQVVRMLEDLAGKPPERSISVDEAVAHGAALYANLLMEQKKGTSEPAQFSVVNVNSHSLGIVGIDPQTGRRRNQILIPKNTPLPHTVTKSFKISKVGQPKIIIRVVEGESVRPEDCVQIGACTIDSLPPNLAPGTPVNVSYAYQADGRLEVRAQIVGQQKAASTVFQRENALPKEQMQMWSDGYIPVEA